MRPSIPFAAEKEEKPKFGLGQLVRTFLGWTIAFSSVLIVAFLVR